MIPRLNVDYKYNLNPSKYPAYWNINKDNGKITFHLGEIWQHSQNNLTGMIDSDPVENFIDDLLYYDLSERICLERAHEKIRIKGGRCKPCCVQYFTQLMLYPFAWETIQQEQGRTPDMAKLAGLLRLPAAIELVDWMSRSSSYGGIAR